MKRQKRLISESKDHHARFRAIEQWRRQRDAQRALIAKGRAVVEDFVTNVGVCALQDYARLNEFLIESSPDQL